jgi:hypothetical protein
MSQHQNYPVRKSSNPNKIIPDANDPIKKVFNPASLLLMLALLLEASTYKAKALQDPRKT